MADWKFGDIIRRHASGPLLQPYAMVIGKELSPDSVHYEWFSVVIVKEGKPTEYRFGKTHSANPDNWTTVLLND